MDKEQKRAIDCLIELRAGARRNPMKELLDLLEPPSQLPGFLQVAQAVLEILRDDSGVPVPQRERFNVPGWRKELRWIHDNAEMLAHGISSSESDRERFKRKRGRTPVRGHGVTRHPLYAQLWETPADEQYLRGFRLLQGHVLFAHFAIRHLMSTTNWQASKEHNRVARGHLYRTSLPLQRIARSCGRHEFADECRQLLVSMPRNLSTLDFADALIERRNKVPADHGLHEDLGLLFSLLKWSVSGSYEPAPRGLSAATGGSQSMGTTDTPRREEFRDEHQSNASEDGQSPESNSAFEIYENTEEDGVLDDSETEGQSGTSRNRGLGITSYSRIRREPKLMAEILASGDHPDNYLSSPSIDLGTHYRGVCLDEGGWREMQNQHLPWSLRELADEELADALIRLDKHAKNGDPESIEILTLAHGLLWTGRPLKNFRPLEIIFGANDASGELGFHLPDAGSTAATSEWRIRALPVPFSEPLTEPLQNPGARLCVPVFTLPDYAGLSKLICRHIEPLAEGHRIGSNIRIFQRDAAQYKDLLRMRLSQDANGKRSDGLARVTFDRIGYILFQRIVDLTGGDMVAASLITGRNIEIAKVDRFYATPSVASLRQVYRKAVASIQQDLIAFGFEFAEIDVADPEIDGTAVGSTICPTVESVKQGLTRIRSRIVRKPSEADGRKRFLHWIDSHNHYSLWAVMTVGWAVGFRAIHDPFIYPNQVDLVSGLTAFQDKGPDDDSKTRLMSLPGFAFTQIDEYCVSLKKVKISILDSPVKIPSHPFFFDENLNVHMVIPSLMESFLNESLPLPANASRHFGRTEWIERGTSPEYVSAWLGHFYRGEEPWGRYSSFRFSDFCHFMREKLPEMLKDLGFLPIDRNGKQIAEFQPEVERFRRRQKARTEQEGVAEHSGSAAPVPSES